MNAIAEEQQHRSDFLQCHQAQITSGKEPMTMLGREKENQTRDQ